MEKRQNTQKKTKNPEKHESKMKTAYCRKNSKTQNCETFIKLKILKESGKYKSGKKRTQCFGAKIQI